MVIEGAHKTITYQGFNLQVGTPDGSRGRMLVFIETGPIPVAHVFSIKEEGVAELIEKLQGGVEVASPEDLDRIKKGNGRP